MVRIRLPPAASQCELRGSQAILLQSHLYGGHARKALGRAGRAAEGAGDRRQGRADAEAVVEAARVARMPIRSRFSTQTSLSRDLTEQAQCTTAAPDWQLCGKHLEHEVVQRGIRHGV